MAHVFVLVEARKLWMDIFLGDLTKRRYPYPMMNGKMGLMQPNIREVKLLDISVPEASMPYLLSDLSPFIDSSSASKKHAALMGKMLRILGRLKPIYPTLRTKYYRVRVIGKALDFIIRLFRPIKHKRYRPSGDIRNKWVNVMVLGWREDPKDPRPQTKAAWPFIPKGGELV